MKAQLSRDNHRPDRHYSGVYQQQGRMLTDADWNELVDIVKRRQRQSLGATVDSGVPRDGGVLEIAEVRDTPGIASISAKLRPGSVIADGVLGEFVHDADIVFEGDVDHEEERLYLQQRFFREPPALPKPVATYYADVWERLVVSIQDATLRDSALYGADTCVRTQVMAQIKACDDPTFVDDRARNPNRGDALFTLRHGRNDVDQDDTCATETSIAHELGNYLFRLEVQSVLGPPNAPIAIELKWSSENGAEAYDIRPASDGTEVLPSREFRDGPWVFEFFSDTTEQHLGVHSDRSSIRRSELRFTGYPSGDIPMDSEGKQFPYVRRWDGYCIVQHSGDGWTLQENQHLGKPIEGSAVGEDGNLKFILEGLILTLDLRDKIFVAGDYWLALLRGHGAGGTAVDVLSNEPVGIVHHYLKLHTKSEEGETLHPTAPQHLPQVSFPPLTHLSADRIGYDPELADGVRERWFDINEQSVPEKVPRTVQDAIDMMAFNLETSDIGYTLPSCTGATTVLGLLGDPRDWPYFDADGRLTVKDVLDTFICQLDSSLIPYETTVGAPQPTIKDRLDGLRTDVDDRVKIPGDTMTGDLAVMAKVGIGIDRASIVQPLPFPGAPVPGPGPGHVPAPPSAPGAPLPGPGPSPLPPSVPGTPLAGLAPVPIRPTVPGGKLHIVGGSTSATFANASAAIEVDNHGDGTAVLQANGDQGPYRISVEGRHGRASQTWNAYDNEAGGTVAAHRYDQGDEGAVWLRFGAGALSVMTAEGGNQDALINWAAGLHQDNRGKVGIGTVSPATALDVDGAVTMKEFMLPPGEEGFVLTSDPDGKGTWQPSKPLGWRKENGNLFSDVPGSVGIGADGIGAGVKLEVDTYFRISEKDGQALDLFTAKGFNVVMARSPEKDKHPLKIRAVHDGSGTPSGAISIDLEVGHQNAPQTALTITEDAEVLPGADRLRRLGGLTSAWKEVWGDQLFGTLSEGTAKEPMDQIDLVARTAQNAIVARANFVQIEQDSTTPLFDHFNVQHLERSGIGIYRITLDQAIDDGCSIIATPHMGTPNVTISSSISSSGKIVDLMGRDHDNKPVEFSFSFVAIGRPRVLPRDG